MSNKATYQKICEQHRNIPVFLQHWWMDAVCADWDVAIATKGEHTTGVWPYPIERKMGVTFHRTPLLTPYLGPYVLFPADIKESNRDGFEHETVTALLQQLPAAQVWHLALQPGLHQAGIFNEQFTISAKQTFLIDLQPEVNSLQANMKENLRRNIRGAEQDITITNEPQLLSKLFEFQKHTLSKKDVMQAHDLASMQRLWDACAANKAAALFVARRGDNIEAIVWNVWDANTSYYLMGAQNPQADGSKAISALLWHCIKEARQRGNKIFDLEGSMDAGVERFFRSFGGTRTLYLTLKKNTSPLWKLKTLLRG